MKDISLLIKKRDEKGEEEIKMDRVIIKGFLTRKNYSTTKMDARLGTYLRN